MSDIVVNKVELPASGAVAVVVTGRVFKVLEASGTFTASFDGGAPMPMAKTRGIGSETAPRFEFILFKDTSGSPNTVEYYAGDKEVSVESTQQVELSTTNVEAINPDAVSFKPGYKQLNNEVLAFNSYNALSIENTGAVNITVTTAEGALVFPPGEKVDWTAPRWKDHLGNVSIDTTGGGTATVRSVRQ